MPKLRCDCGHAIDETISPTQGEHFFIDGASWDEVVSRLSNAVLSESFDSDLLAERLSDALAASGRYFYKCPSCAGLMVSRGGGSFDYYVSSPRKR